MDGFFVAKLVKYADGSKKEIKTNGKPKKKKAGKKIEDVQENYDKDQKVVEDSENAEEFEETGDIEKNDESEVVQEEVPAEKPKKEKKFLNKKRNNKEKKKNK